MNCWTCKGNTRRRTCKIREGVRDVYWFWKGDGLLRSRVDRIGICVVKGSWYMKKRWKERKKRRPVREHKGRRIVNKWAWWGCWRTLLFFVMMRGDVCRMVLSYTGWKVLSRSSQWSEKKGIKVGVMRKWCCVRRIRFEVGLENSGLHMNSGELGWS